MCRSPMCTSRDFLLWPLLTPTDLATALLAEVESRTISIDAGRAAPATAVTARFGVVCFTLGIRTQLPLASTLALKERATRATVGTDLAAGCGCANCTQ